MMKRVFMVLWIVVMTSLIACNGDPERLAALQSDQPSSLTTEEYGEQLFRSMGCHACHAIAPAILLAPSMSGIAGSTRPLIGGRTMIADDDYLVRALHEPGAEIAEGFRDDMPSYADSLSETQTRALIAYLKTLI